MGVKTLKFERDDRSGFSSGINAETFELLFTMDQFAMAISNFKGELIKSNKPFEKFLSESSESIDLREFVSTIQRQRVLLAGPHNFSVEVPGKRMRLSCIRVAAEIPAHVIYLWTLSVEVNLSFRNKLIELKNLYRSFMDTSFELLFRTDLQGNVLFANKVFVDSFGWTSSEINKGLRVDQLLEDGVVFHETLGRLSEAGKISELPLVFRKKNGNAFPAVVNVHRLHDGSDNRVINWTVLDITRQKEGEQNLKLKNDELAKVNYQMEKFLYSTSHDLRSPIATILGLLNLIRMEVKSALMADYVSKIEISTLKLDKIIKDIMSFSKATYQRINSEKIDFEAQAWKAFNNYRDDPATRKLSFEVNVASTLPFYTDTERLDIILDNVVRNSIHFFDPNKLKSFIRVNITSDKHSASLEILDNGIGIGAQHSDNIFKMFYKASHLSKGAGLGLYIVKETVEKLHGEITVESEVGFGTVIRIRIPNDHKGKLIGRKLLLQSNFAVSIPKK